MKIDATILALTEALVQERCSRRVTNPQVWTPEVVRFVTDQQTRMPDYLRPPLRGLTILFRASASIRFGRPFHKLSHERRWRQIRAWNRSPLGFQRDFIKFFETIIVFAWHAARYPQDYQRAPGNTQVHSTDFSQEC